MLCCRCRVEFLSSFAPPPGAGSASVATPLVERFAARLLVLFVRHAALLRPLSQAGKLQLAKVRFTALSVDDGCKHWNQSRKQLCAGWGRNLQILSDNRLN
jgi:hypothetical protein